MSCDYRVAVLLATSLDAIAGQATFSQLSRKCVYVLVCQTTLTTAAQNNGQRYAAGIHAYIARILYNWH